MLKSSGGGRGGGGVDEVQTSVVAGENRIGKWELERELERLDQARDQRGYAAIVLGNALLSVWNGTRGPTRPTVIGRFKSRDLDCASI